MRHRIEDNINAEWISLFLREFPEIVFVFPFSFPSISKVRVMADDHNHSIVIVVDGLVLGFASIWPLPGNPSVLTRDTAIDGWNLRPNTIELFVQRKDTIENSVVHGNILGFPVRKNALELFVQVLVRVNAPKVVKHG